jgi:hypothetical protein
MASLAGTLRSSRISRSWYHINNVTRQSAGRENRQQSKGRQQREANLERPQPRFGVDANRLDDLFGAVLISWLDNVVRAASRLSTAACVGATAVEGYVQRYRISEWSEQPGETALITAGLHELADGA